jgi:hypothetical protein
MARTRKNLRRGGQQPPAPAASTDNLAGKKRSRKQAFGTDVVQERTEDDFVRPQKKTAPSTLPTPEDVVMAPEAPASAFGNTFGFPGLGPSASAAEPVPWAAAQGFTFGQTAPKKEKASVSASSSSGPAPACPSEIMKYHLRADMNHDDTSFNNEKFSVLFGGTAADGVRAPSLKEADVVKYIKDNFDAEDKAIRLDNTLTFTHTMQTALFPQHGGSSFKPFNGIDNSKIGVLQDAGFQLFSAMGAKNLITFGSILDQAGKPISPEKQPYIFSIPKSLEKTLLIDPCIYGFDKAAFEENSKVEISDFDEIKVKCKFKFKGKFEDDDDDIKIYNGGTTTDRTKYFDLIINQRRGDFKSNTEVQKLDDDKDRKDKFAAYIGKALGDIMLVASLTPEINGNPNPFYPDTKTLINLHNREIFGAERLMLNTGDQLNHIRAYMFGIDTVYSSSSNKTSNRTFEYIPGVSQVKQTDEQIKVTYLELIKNLIIQVDNTYREFISHLNGLIKDGNFNYINTIYGKDAYFIKKDDILNLERAKNTIIYLINIVQTFRTYVLFYYFIFYKYHQNDTRTSLNSEKLKKLKQTYEILMSKTPGLMPSSTTTLSSSNVLSCVNILKTDILYFSEYPLFDKEVSINEIAYVNYHYTKVFNVMDPNEVDFIPKKTVDKWINEINRDTSRDIIFPESPLPITTSGIIAGSYNFYVSEIYQLIGKSGHITAARLSNIFNVFNFNIDKTFLEGKTTGRGTFIGGQEGAHFFAQTFREPNYNVPDIVPVGMKLKVPEKEYCSDLLLEFLEGFEVDVLVGAVQTYNYNHNSIVDAILLKHLYSDYKDSIGHIDDELRKIYENVPEIYEELRPNEQTLPKIIETLPLIDENKLEDSTRESLLFNSFTCRYNAEIVKFSKTPLVPYPNPIPVKETGDELESLLNEYAVQFEALANAPREPRQKLPIPPVVISASVPASAPVPAPAPATTPMNMKRVQYLDEKLSGISQGKSGPPAGSPGASQAQSEASSAATSRSASPIKKRFANIFTSPERSSQLVPLGREGGQRVPAENPLIDLTKSFVRRGGSSPNSEVK